MKKTPEEKYIEELKEKALLHTVNFEGDMIVGNEQLAKMFKEYATQCQQDNAERRYTKQELEKYFMIRHTQSVANAEKYLTTLNKQ